MIRSKLRAFCDQKWMKAEKDLNGLSPRSRKYKQILSRTEFWRKMHARVEDEELSTHHDEWLQTLVSSNTGQYTTLHREGTRFPVPEELR